MAAGSTRKARFFTLRHCPECMCDPGHNRSQSVRCTRPSEQASEIGNIVRNTFFAIAQTWRSYQGFARNTAPRPTRQPPGRRSRVARRDGFPLRKQGQPRAFTSQIRFPKIPNLKAFPRRFSAGSTNGDKMGTAASSFLNPIAAELEGVDPQPTAKALARRAGRRRQIQGMVGVSYVVDAAILLLYAYAGTIPVTIAPAYAGCGLALVAINIALSAVRLQRALQGPLSGRAAVGAVHGGCAWLRLCRAGSRRDVPLHAVHRVRLLLAACDAAADRGDLDRDGARSGRTVPFNRQADFDAARQLSRTASPRWWCSSSPSGAACSSASSPVR